MNKQQASSSNSSDEMDLSDMFNYFKRGFYNFLKLCFKAIDFIIKVWWVILLLIVIGFVIGLLNKGDTKYKSTLVININYDSEPYVYNAVQQFTNNIQERDSAFLKSLNLNVENPEILKVTIEPVVDVINLISKIKDNDDRNLETVVKELKRDDDIELFATDRFYSNYKYHKLIIELNNEKAKEKIQALMDYINNQPFITKLKAEAIKSHLEVIERDEQMLRQMDTVIATYAKSANIPSGLGNQLSIYSTESNIDFEGVFVQKLRLINEIERLKTIFIGMSDAMVVVSDIQTSPDSSILDKKHVLYPVLLVFFFLIIALIRYTYISLKRKIQ